MQSDCLCRKEDDDGMRMIELLNQKPCVVCVGGRSVGQSIGRGSYETESDPNQFIESQLWWLKRNVFRSRRRQLTCLVFFRCVLISVTTRIAQWGCATKVEEGRKKFHWHKTHRQTDDIQMIRKRQAWSVNPNDSVSSDCRMSGQPRITTGRINRFKTIWFHIESIQKGSSHSPRPGMIFKISTPKRTNR